MCTTPLPLSSAWAACPHQDESSRAMKPTICDECMGERMVLAAMSHPEHSTAIAPRMRRKYEGWARPVAAPDPISRPRVRPPRRDLAQSCSTVGGWSASSIDKAGRLDAGLEFLADRAVIQERDLRGHLERLQHVCLDALPQLLDIGASLGLDEQAQDIQAGLCVVNLRLEVRNAWIEEHQVFQLVVIDVDAAHLEEADGSSRMLHHRKNRPGLVAADCPRDADEIARVPAQERRHVIVE